MSPPTFLPLKIVLAILVCVTFPSNFRMSLSVSPKLSAGILTAVELKPLINLGKSDILTIFIQRFPNHDVNKSPYLFSSSSISSICYIYIYILHIYILDMFILDSSLSILMGGAVNGTVLLNSNF